MCGRSTCLPEVVVCLTGYGVDRALPGPNLMVHCVLFMFLISDLLNLNWTEIHLSGAELLSTDLLTLMFPLNQCHG